ERPVAVRQFNRFAVRSRANVERPVLEVEVWNRADPVDRQYRECAKRHDHRNLERQLHTAQVEVEKYEVAAQPPQWLILRASLEDRGHVRADEEHDYGWRQHILDVLGKTGDEAAP